MIVGDVALLFKFLQCSVHFGFSLGGGVLKGTDVAGGVVPGEDDVGAISAGHLEVADMIVLGSCIAT